MSFQQVIGQERAKHMLQNALRNDKCSHAYLFSGPTGTGKGKMAIEFAKAVLCTEQTDDACDQCPECKKVEHGNHPHVIRVEPDGASIKIEQVRELQKLFTYRSASNQPNIVIISQAERMTTQSANSLLKFLEEPVSQIIVILITDNGQALLPTIRSRTQWVPFLPMSPQQMKEQLIAEGLDRKLVLSAVYLTSGIDAARTLIQSDWFAEIRSQMIQLAKESLNQFAYASMLIQDQLVKNGWLEHIELILDLFTLWFKDMIHLQCGRKDQLVFIDQSAWLAQHAFSREFSHWIHCMEQAVQTRKTLRYHANPQLALEHFLSQV